MLSERTKHLLAAVLAAVVAIGFIASVADTALAHQVSRGLGSAIVLRFQSDRLHLTYDLGYGALFARNAMVEMDTDQDVVVSEEEAESFREKAWEERVLPNLAVFMNGHKVPVRRVSSRQENLVGEIATLPFDLYYEIEVEIPYATPDDRRRKVRAEIRNTSLSKGSSNVPFFYVPFSDHAREVTYEIVEPPPMLDFQSSLVMGEKLVVEFDLSRGDRLDGAAQLIGDGPGDTTLENDDGTTGAAVDSEASTSPETIYPPTPREAVTPAPRRAVGLDAFVELFGSGPLVFGEALGAVLLAFLYGMAHALSLLHAKALVTAHLFATRSRVRDAVMLGLVVAAVSALGTLGLGFAVYIVSGDAGRFAAAATLVGNAALVIAGLVIAAKRWRLAGHPERHDDGPGGSARSSLRELAAVGLGGGLAVGPAGLAIVSSSLSSAALLTAATFLVLSFSLGLGAVVTSLGTLLVTLRGQLVDGKREALFSYLPLTSGLFLAATGAVFLVRSLL